MMHQNAWCAYKNKEIKWTHRVATAVSAKTVYQRTAHVRSVVNKESISGYS